jgi:hypothetical protein
VAKDNPGYDCRLAAKTGASTPVSTGWPGQREGARAIICHFAVFGFIENFNFFALSGQNENKSLKNLTGRMTSPSQKLKIQCFNIMHFI